MGKATGLIRFGSYNSFLRSPGRKGEAPVYIVEVRRQPPWSRIISTAVCREKEPQVVTDCVLLTCSDNMRRLRNGSTIQMHIHELIASFFFTQPWQRDKKKRCKNFIPYRHRWQNTMWLKFYRSNYLNTLDQLCIYWDNDNTYNIHHIIIILNNDVMKMAKK